MVSLERVTQVGIVGSGIMGSGLAEVVASAGYPVVVRSRTRTAAETLLTSLGRSLDKQVAKGKLGQDERDTIVARITVTDDLGDLAECGIVIESVVEDLAVKKALIAQIGDVVKPNVLIATNTSTLPIVDLAMHAPNPDRVCGIHFFNPAPAMSLVELIRPITASDEAMELARAFAVSCGKDPVEVVDRAGFIVNALLFPYLNNAVRLWERGTASLEDIDTAMKGGCNFPMGPFALLDLVGLDTSLSILDALHAEFKDPNFAAVPILRRMVAAGRLGRKTGRGFYVYPR